MTLIRALTYKVSWEPATDQSQLEGQSQLALTGTNQGQLPTATVRAKPHWATKKAGPLTELKDSLEALQAQQLDGTDCCVGADQVVGLDDQLAEPHISANVANGSFNGQKFNG